MAREDIKELIRKAADDPEFLNALLDARGSEKQEVIRREDLQLGDRLVSRRELIDDIKELCTPADAYDAVGDPEARAVEWVAAVATAAAGALAAL
ncbi:MAG: hypothetical protein ACRDZO_04815 [Egibacteraceae bacterium]